MKAVVALAVVVLVALGVVALRDATMSTHQPVAPGSRLAVVVAARTHNRPAAHTTAEMARAAALACRLQVGADVVDDRVERVGSGRYRFVLRPSLDASDRKQFTGCLQDWRVDHLRLDVIETLPVPLGAAADGR